jgi:hypothetical protein
MANLIVSAVSTFDNKGLKKGQKEISAFDKTVKTLGKTFLGVFGAQKLLQFSKEAVKAFMEDEKAAKSLEVQLKNTGYAFSAPGVELYIANLQKATGVLDDQLRPALQTLLTASGSLTQSQKALAVALDVSAATGKSVTEVSAAMAKGFSGQTTALTRLGAGLSKATLASGDMNKILDELQAKFSGQALARLDTYAGQMDLLTVAAFNAKETIGKGLLDAISLLGDNNDIQSATKEMDKFAKATSDATIGAGVLLSTLKGLKDIPGIGPVLKAIYSQTIPGLLGTLGRQEQVKQKSNFTYSLGSGAASEIAKQKEADALKKAAKARAEELRLLLLKNGLENKNVEELKKKFDLERIGLTAALNQATDAETQLRLKAQLAILDNNEVLAKKYLAELEAAEALKKLAEATKDLDKAFRDTIAKLAIYDPVRSMAPGQGGPFIPETNVPKVPFVGTPFGQAGGNTGPINTTVQLVMSPNAGDFEQLIYNSFLINQKNGNSQTVNGAV